MSIQILLGNNILIGSTYKLLLDPLDVPKALSTHILEHTMRKSICLRQYLFRMVQCDNDDLIAATNEIGTKANEIATAVGLMNRVGQGTVYQYYCKWCDGEKNQRGEINGQIKLK